MKTKILMLALFLSVAVSAVAQKKSNGTIYIEHPAITVVDDFLKAFLAQDNKKLATFLTDDFTWVDGTSGEKLKKDEFVSGLIPIQDFDYFTITRHPGSYPDAIEYEKDNKDGAVAVAAWYIIKGVHKKSGVKIDAPAHFQFGLTKDLKIKEMLQYSNSDVFNEIRSSKVDRKNGTIYNHHEFINTVRKSMYAFEKGDVDKCMSYYADNVKFSDINDAPGISRNKEEELKGWKDFLAKFEIKSIDVVGYPDYLEYEMGGKTVLSWWKFNLIRKSDKKEIPMYFHFSTNFDENGKIISEMAYYSKDLLK